MMEKVFRDVDNVSLFFLVIVLLGITVVVGISNHRFHRNGLRFGWKLDFFVWMFFGILFLREANRMRYRAKYDLPDDKSLVVMTTLLALAAGGMVISWIGERNDRRDHNRLKKPDLG